jgi:hypothetical protein
VWWHYPERQFLANGNDLQEVCRRNASGFKVNFRGLRSRQVVNMYEGVGKAAQVR